MTTRTGVLVMAHGTPDTPEEIEPFYTRIRRGRPPTPELLDELTGRYEAIGGTSPLTTRTRAQVDGLAAALEAVAPGRFLVRLGTKYVHPTIEEAVADLSAEGATAVVVCAVGFVSDHLEVLYDLDIEAQDKADALGIAFARTTSLNDDPAFLAMLADVVVEAADTTVASHP